MENRIIEVYRDNAWHKVEMKDLEIGAVFRTFEPTGEQVKDEGKALFQVTEKPKLIDEIDKDGNEFKTWSVMVESYESFSDIPEDVKSDEV